MVLPGEALQIALKHLRLIFLILDNRNTDRHAVAPFHLPVFWQITLRLSTLFTQDKIF